MNDDTYKLTDIDLDTTYVTINTGYKDLWYFIRSWITGKPLRVYANTLTFRGITISK